MDSPSGRPEIIWTNVVFFAVWTVLTVAAVPWYAVTYGVTWVETAALIGLWVLTGVSITAGYHRLFSHRAYSASAPVRLFFALFGAAAWEASIITWSAHHRFHHRHVDTDDDPYNATEGFWHSHIGWLLVKGAKHDDLSNVPDLWKDPICAWHYGSISHRWSVCARTPWNVCSAPERLSTPGRRLEGPCGGHAARPSGP